MIIPNHSWHWHEMLFKETQHNASSFLPGPPKNIVNLNSGCVPREVVEILLNLCRLLHTIFLNGSIQWVFLFSSVDSVKMRLYKSSGNHNACWECGAPRPLQCWLGFWRSLLPSRLGSVTHGGRRCAMLCYTRRKLTNTISLMMAGVAPSASHACVCLCVCDRWSVRNLDSQLWLCKCVSDSNDSLFQVNCSGVTASFETHNNTQSLNST